MVNDCILQIFMISTVLLLKCTSAADSNDEIEYSTAAQIQEAQPHPYAFRYLTANAEPGDPFPRTLSEPVRGQVGPTCFQHAMATAIRPWVAEFAHLPHREIRNLLFEPWKKELESLNSLRSLNIIFARIANKYNLQYRRMSHKSASVEIKMEMATVLLNAGIPIIVYANKVGMEKLGFVDIGAHSMVIDSVDDSNHGDAMSWNFRIKNSHLNAPWLSIPAQTMSEGLRNEDFRLFFFWSDDMKLVNPLMRDRVQQSLNQREQKYPLDGYVKVFTYLVDPNSEFNSEEMEELRKSIKINEDYFS